MTGTVNAREAAVRALTAYENNGAWADAYLDGLIRNEGLDAREAALATRLCAGVLQNRAACDWYLEPYVKKKLHTEVRQILRTAVYQIAFMDRIPVHAAVSEAVKLARKLTNSGAASLVNAVLRRLTSSPLPELPNGDDPDSLAVRYSHSTELVQYFSALIGTEKTRLLLEANNTPPRISLRVNRLKCCADDVLERLRAQGIEARVQGDFIYPEKTGNVAELDVFREGMVTVQDAAAAQAVVNAMLRPGMRVLDACAAPGGKSFLAAQIMENRGEILSCDIYSSKLPDITEGAARLGINIIKTGRMDASKPRPEFSEGFDAVLADVPCSGLGVIRKKPEIRYKKLGELAGLPEIQLAIADNLAGYVKPGGVLMYSTCTLLREENEGVTGAFLSKHGEFEKETEKTLWPFDGETDGFYICRMRKKT